MSNIKSIVSKGQILGNLRRTAKEGLISLLDQEELEKLAIKYYGETDENGNLIRYYCPYSGESINDVNKIVLEHIIPVTSNGGTVLFNCIPVFEQVNKSNEKGALHLLEWWTKKEYYRPEKLDKLLSYIFEAYDIVFKNNTIKEVKNSYDDIDLDEEENIKETNEITTSINESKKIKEQAYKTGLISYLGFINDCINELKDKNYDISKYEIKLKEYENQGIFKEVERYTLFQNILKETIKDKLGEDNRSALRYILNINISNLMDSMKEHETPEEITKEILIRINNIENILNKNNIDIISFFEDLKKHEILYKDINQITKSEIENFITEINLCVSDKFQQLCSFVTSNNGDLPNKYSNNAREKQLGAFINSIKSVKDNKRFHLKLNKEQLKYLHDSKHNNLREIYKVILNKTVENNIEIEYVDNEMKLKILEFYEKKKNISTIEDEIQLENEYQDVIIIKNQFNEFIDFVLNNKGNLPNEDGKSEKERRLGNFKTTIKIVKDNKYFRLKLNKEQLKYLHDSKHNNLREIYKVILNKAVENNIEIEYVNNEMKLKILEFYEKKKNISTIEDEMQLEKEYQDFIIIKSQFNEMINFVLNNNGVLPNQNGITEKEQKLGRYRNYIQTVKNGNVITRLKNEQLKYLYDSKYEGLREIYKVILNKAIENNIEIEYVNSEMKLKILEFYEKKKNISTIKDEIQLEKEYQDFIIIKSQFNEMINFVINNNGILPNQNGVTEEEQKLGRYKHSIQVIRNNKFATKLSVKQLKYLHDSKYEGLREIYKVILNKAIENNIELEFVDNEMKLKILEFYEKKKNISTIEDEIQLENEYQDVIIIKNQFNEFVDFVIKNNGRLPSVSSENEKEQRLGNFKNNIQRIKNGCKFHSLLSKQQLEYLYNSKYENLLRIYQNIIEKAYNINYSDYISIDNEIRKEKMKGKVA